MIKVKKLKLQKFLPIGLIKNLANTFRLKVAIFTAFLASLSLIHSSLLESDGKLSAIPNFW